MEGKNVLYICDYAAPYPGSFIPAISALVKEVSRHNQVYFLFPEKSRDMPWLSMLGTDKKQIFFTEFSVKNLTRECRRLSGMLGKMSIVHTHFVADFRLAAVRLSFCNVVCHYHMMVPYGKTVMKKLKRLVRLPIYWNCVIIGVSEAVAKDTQWYFRWVKSECIPNAIDFRMLDECSAESVVLEKGAPGQFRVLIHGSDFVCKGVDIAIKAIQELNHESDNGFRLYMTSNTVSATEENIRRITEETENIAVIQSVKNIKSLYDSVDLFISPSREEAFSYAVVEASYSGCQVAASDIPGQNTMKSIPGVIWFEKDDAAGLKNAILEARRRREDGSAAKIKEEQRTAAVREFRIEKWVEQNLAVYSKYFG